MTAIELARMVKAVREVQRAYFRGRTWEALEESKRREKELDAVLEEILEDRPPLMF